MQSPVCCADIRLRATSTCLCPGHTHLVAYPCQHPPHTLTHMNNKLHPKKQGTVRLPRILLSLLACDCIFCLFYITLKCHQQDWSALRQGTSDGSGELDLRSWGSNLKNTKERSFKWSTYLGGLDLAINLTTAYLPL